MEKSNLVKLFKEVENTASTKEIFHLAIKSAEIMLPLYEEYTPTNNSVGQAIKAAKGANESTMQEIKNIFYNIEEITDRTCNAATANYKYYYNEKYDEVYNETSIEIIDGGANLHDAELAAAGYAKQEAAAYAIFHAADSIANADVVHLVMHLISSCIDVVKENSKAATTSAVYAVNKAISIARTMDSSGGNSTYKNKLEKLLA